MQEDPFTQLGVPASFDLDEAALTRAWLAMSATLHPDRATDPGNDSEIARRSAQVNAARETLADPERRANALLAKLSGPASDECKDLSDGFLMDIFEVREAMEEAVSSGGEAARAQFEELASDRRGAHIERVRELFTSVGDLPNGDALREIRIELNAWRYIERMIEQLDV